ncbi:MAG: hypothetical protein HOP08_05665 [Cyclobacteriaceae bacterium]|nr:hypothetical protein [Cyclobacteriaceae bacterium]
MSQPDYPVMQRQYSHRDSGRESFANIFRTEKIDMRSLVITLNAVCALLFCFFLSTNTHAQSIEIRNIEFFQNKLVIHYDLLDSIEGRFYTIKVYSSADGYLNPLEKLKGDAGLEVKSGKNKTITWAFGEDLSTGYSGKVALELRGRHFIPFIQTDEINKYKVFKRKQIYNLTWTGGTPQNVLNFDLYKKDKKITSFSDIANVGHYTFQFPSHIRPGKDYQFVISDTKNKDEVVRSNSFRIKRKIPLLVKAIPTLAAGTLIYLLARPASDETIPAFPKDIVPK